MPGWSVAANVTADAAGRRRHELRRACRRAGDGQAGRARRDGQLDRRAGLDRLGRRRRAAEQLAGQVGEQDREGDLEGQVGAARLEGQDRGRQAVADAGVQQRRAARARDDRARPVGQWSAAGLGDVGRRQVDVAQDRLVGIERADARVRRACRPPRRARSCAAGRWPGSASAAASPGRKPSKMTRSHGRPSLRSRGRPVLVRRDAEQLDVGQVATARSRGTGSPSPTTRTSRVRSGGMTAHARSSTASWSGAATTAGSRPDEPDLERAHVRGRCRRRSTFARACGLERHVADLEQAAVAPQLEPARRALQVEVRDADEDRPRHGRRRRS